MKTQKITQSPASGNSIRYLLFILRLLTAAAFLAAGGAKLAGIPMMVAIYEHIGLGQWFRILTGMIEVSSAIALFIPSLSGLAGFVLAITMCCAIVTHLFVIGGNPMPAIILLLMTAVIAWCNRADILHLLRKR